ncbi:hypothetical protein [Chitinimonas koreensis]|uniref:hypothetical protein n=1 Tax=Chitinimonas koreensis TaxID=356302 RepID=UPI00041E7A14|nr:hypothetical protein [Chitinimonas koreensis]QNM94923.1 hypothetical protein H9L41_13435 [Chitinimonas koreensis]
MTYTTYGEDYHVAPRAESCPILGRPRAECRCDACEAARASAYPSDVESDGGEL